MWNIWSVHFQQRYQGKSTQKGRFFSKSSAKKVNKFVGGKLLKPNSHKNEFQADHSLKHKKLNYKVPRRKITGEYLHNLGLSKYIFAEDSKHSKY